MSPAASSARPPPAVEVQVPADVELTDLDAVRAARAAAAPGGALPLQGDIDVVPVDGGGEPPAVVLGVNPDAKGGGVRIAAVVEVPRGTGTSGGEAGATGDAGGSPPDGETESAPLRYADVRFPSLAEQLAYIDSYAATLPPDDVWPVYLRAAALAAWDCPRAAAAAYTAALNVAFGPIADAHERVAAVLLSTGDVAAAAAAARRAAVLRVGAVGTENAAGVAFEADFGPYLPPPPGVAAPAVAVLAAYAAGDDRQAEAAAAVATVTGGGDAGVAASAATAGLGGGSWGCGVPPPPHAPRAAGQPWRPLTRRRVPPPPRPSTPPSGRSRRSRRSPPAPSPLTPSPPRRGR